MRVRNFGVSEGVINLTWRFDHYFKAVKANIESSSVECPRVCQSQSEQSSSNLVGMEVVGGFASLAKILKII